MSQDPGKVHVNKIKALVVDDSAYTRSALAQMLTAAGDIEVVGTAKDGVDAISKTLRLAPDVITLDLEMPTMDGYTFLRWLMKERPTPVVVISAQSDSRSVFRALELGAVDFLAKPETRISRRIEALGEELIAKVHAVMHLEMGKVQSSIGLLARERPALPVRKDEDAVLRPGPIEVVAIAASTGGPPALQAILTSLPGELPASVVVAQHMPPGFTRSFAERLNKICALLVSEAAGGERVRPGMVLIAPGGHHLLLRRDRQGLLAEIVPRHAADKYAPSADRLMTSVAEACGRASLGVVLTGMGNDGAEGAAAIKDRGGRCLAESEESAVIFGMPQEAIRRGAVDKVLPLARIAAEIVQRCDMRDTGV
jgi:two-component system chemotaxis response regulator CheB